MTIFGNLSGTFKNLFSIGKNNKILIGNDSGNLTFDVNDAEALRIETDGTLKVSTADYENLVTADDDIPNKKFVSDITDNLKTIQNYADSPGIISGGAITEGTNAGTFKVAALTAFLRSTDSEIGDLVGVSLSEQDNQTITAADTYYIITLNYNGGSPTISLSTSNPYDADKRNIPIGQVMKTSGNTVHYISGGYDFQDGVKKLHERAKLLRKLELASGSTIAYSGTNNFTMTTGIVFGGLNKFTISSYNSATTTFTPIYGDGSTGFTEGAERNTIDYTKYDDGSGTLANVSNNKYSCHWVYRHIDDGHIFVVYGNCNDLLTVAESSSIPAIPAYLTNFGVLIGKIIAPKAGGSFATIQMINETFFSGSTPPVVVESTTIVDSITALRALDYTPSSGDTFTVLGYASPTENRDWSFVWDTSDLSTEITNDTLGGIYVALNSSSTGANGAFVRAFEGPVNVEWYAVNTTPGTTDMTVAARSAINSGYTDILVESMCYITSAISIPGNITVRGSDRTGSGFTTALNIEMFQIGTVFNVNLDSLSFKSTYPLSDVAQATFTGDTTTGSSVITNPSSIVGLYKGMKLTGTGIPAGSYIANIRSGTVIIGSSTGVPVNATATNVGTSFATATREGQTVYQVHATNSSLVHVKNCYFNSAYTDADFSVNSVSGMYFERESGQPGFVNTVSDCFFDHASLNMESSDSSVTNNHIWGMPFEFALKLAGPGIAVKGNNISGCQRKGGIWITPIAAEPAGSSIHKIANNNIDGGGVYYAGYGIYGSGLQGCAITGNTFNLNHMSGMYLENPLFTTITGNAFYNNNIDDASHSDIEINSTILAGSLTISGNNMTRTAAQTYPGYAIKEVVNGGSTPVNSTYTANTISANYSSPSFLIVNESGNKVYGNIRFAGENEPEFGTWTMGVSFGGGTTGITYTLNSGTYSKIGRQVSVAGYIVLSSKGTDTGAAKITGLPYTIGTGSSFISAGNINTTSITFADQIFMGGIHTTKTMSLTESTTAGVVSNITDADFTNTSVISMSLTYFTD